MIQPSGRQCYGRADNPAKSAIRVTGIVPKGSSDLPAPAPNAAEPMAGPVAVGTRGADAWPPNALQWAAENRRCEFSRDSPGGTSLAGLERILGPILAGRRHTRARAAEVIHRARCLMPEAMLEYFATAQGSSWGWR